jgi:hypothetical protein
LASAADIVRRKDLFYKPTPDPRTPLKAEHHATCNGPHRLSEACVAAAGQARGQRAVRVSQCLSSAVLPAETTDARALSGCCS